MLCLGIFSFLILVCFKHCFDVVNVVSKPNIIFIIADDVGWNDLSFHGSDQISTPNIDALAYHGVALRRHYSHQVCTPSRAALLTSKYPIRYGYQGYPLSLGLHKFIPHHMKTLPKSLKSKGYKTHLIGKWHLGHGKKEHTPMGYGFDSHYGYWNGYIGYFDHSVGSFDKYNGTDFHDNYKPIKDQVGQYATDLFTQRAEKIIKEHAIDEPLYLVVSHLAGHTGKTVKGIETILEVHNITETNIKYDYIDDINRRMYTEIIERMDDSVGKVVDALAKKDMLNNSIIVFMSDNGAPTFGLHANAGSNYPLRGIKMTMYEGAIRTPAVLYSPLIKNKGRAYDHLFHITDWFPTLFKAAGGNVKELGNLDGIDHWSNMINEENLNVRSELLVDIDDKFNYAAYIGYNGRYKLINNSHFFDNYSGHEGFRNNDLHYDIVKHSLVNIHLENSASHNILDYNKLSTLRNQNSINCTVNDYKELRSNIKPCVHMCLYDLWEDPCEYHNIAADNPEIVTNLWKKIETFNKQAMPKPQLQFDELADPQFCNNTWYNWLDKDGCWYKSSIQEVE